MSAIVARIASSSAASDSSSDSPSGSPIPAALGYQLADSFLVQLVGVVLDPGSVLRVVHVGRGDARLRPQLLLNVFGAGGAAEVEDLEVGDTHEAEYTDTP